jgi:MFS family permease
MTYTIQFLDKLSLNYANAYTLTPDLGLQGQRYAWVAAIFNFGYLFWALPANYLIQRLPVAKYTGTMLPRRREELRRHARAALLPGHV